MLVFNLNLLLVAISLVVCESEVLYVNPIEVIQQLNDLPVDGVEIGVENDDQKTKWRDLSDDEMEGGVIEKDAEVIDNHVKQLSSVGELFEWLNNSEDEMQEGELKKDVETMQANEDNQYYDDDNSYVWYDSEDEGQPEYDLGNRGKVIRKRMIELLQQRYPKKEHDSIVEEFDDRITEFLDNAQNERNSGVVSEMKSEELLEKSLGDKSTEEELPEEKSSGEQSSEEKSSEENSSEEKSSEENSSEEKSSEEESSEEKSSEEESSEEKSSEEQSSEKLSEDNQIHPKLTVYQTFYEINVYKLAPPEEAIIKPEEQDTNIEDLPKFTDILENKRPIDRRNFFARSRWNIMSLFGPLFVISGAFLTCFAIIGLATALRKKKRSRKTRLDCVTRLEIPYKELQDVKSQI